MEAKKTMSIDLNKSFALGAFFGITMTAIAGAFVYLGYLK